MAEWVISLHAATYSEVKSLGNMGTRAAVHQLVQIPTGITMYFYVREGTPLNSNVAWPLFHQLMGSPVQISRAKSCAVEIRRGPEAVFDYQISGDDGWRDRQGTASGIFEAGNRHGAQNWGFRARDRRSLRWLFQYCSPGDTLHWLCCRSWF